MYLPEVELHEAADLEQASRLLREYAPGARILAGGTDLLVDLKTGRTSLAHVVAIDRIAELRGVRTDGGAVCIGALTTISQLDRCALLRGPLVAIRDATSRMAAPQVRNMATVGGNIVSAVPCADLPPVFMVLGASVRLWSPAGQRDVELPAFFTGVRATARRDDEILTEVRIPPPPRRFGAAYARFALREGNAIAVASVAASLTLGDDGTIRGVRLALGAVAPIPKTVTGLDEALVGRSCDADALDEAARLAVDASEPISDVRGSAQFRRHIVGVLARRALTTARRRVEEHPV